MVNIFWVFTTASGIETEQLGTRHTQCFSDNILKNVTKFPVEFQVQVSC